MFPISTAPSWASASQVHAVNATSRTRPLIITVPIFESFTTADRATTKSNLKPGTEACVVHETAMTIFETLTIPEKALLAGVIGLTKSSQEY